jgi:hypothetical protein
MNKQDERIGTKMTIRKKTNKERPLIDLSGPQGNAFYLIGVVKETFRRSGARELGDDIVKEMMSGDYEHLVKTFDLYLGEHFDIVR